MRAWVLLPLLWNCGGLAAAPPCDGVRLPEGDTERLGCVSDVECVNTCAYGAVHVRWARRLWIDCEDGCAGPWQSAPRCEAGRCVSINHQGQRSDACTARPLDAPVCVTAEEQGRLSAQLAAITAIPSPFPLDTPPPVARLGQPADTLSSEAGARYTVAAGRVVAVQVPLDPLRAGPAAWTAWRADHPGPADALLPGEAAAMIGLQVTQPPLWREGRWYWVPGDLLGAPAPVWGTLDPDQRLLTVSLEPPL